MYEMAYPLLPYDRGSGIETFSKSHPTVMPEVLEAGTLNIHGIAGMLAGVKYIHDTESIRFGRKSSI